MIGGRFWGGKRVVNDGNDDDVVCLLACLLRLTFVACEDWRIEGIYPGLLAVHAIDAIDHNECYDFEHLNFTYTIIVLSSAKSYVFKVSDRYPY